MLAEREGPRLILRGVRPAIEKPELLQWFLKEVDFT
jgi:hypothetical protein